MEYTTFKEEQKKIIEKREKERRISAQREKMKEANMMDKITSFFEENKEVIIDATLDSFMKELHNESSPPYRVDLELNTSLVSDICRNEYDVLFEGMIKAELKRKTNAAGNFQVNSAILSKDNGYYSCGCWVPTGGCHNVMKISISLDF